MKYIIPFLYNFKLTVLILVLIIIFIILKLFFKPNYKKIRHKHKIITGDKIIAKLNSFSGIYKNQQILAYLRKIDPYAFEELVLSAFALKGFDIVRNKS
jgi:restriction system protein